MAVKQAIKAVLPNLTEDLLATVTDKLVDSGADTLEDLKYVEEGDLMGILKPIQCRKLLHAWKSTGESVVENGASAAATVTQNQPEAATVTIQYQSESNASQNMHRSPLIPRTNYNKNDPTWVDQYQVNWEDDSVPDGIREAIKSKKRPLNKDRKEFVRKLAKDICKHEQNPTIEKVRCVVKKIVREYPNSFEDRTDESERLGCGYYSLVRQVKTRIEHMNRGNTFNRLRKPRQKRNGNDASAESPGSNPADTYGCVNWQPEMPQNTENLEQKQLELKQLFFQEGPKGSHRSHIDELMKETFCFQRQDINSQLPIDELKGKWPFLFQQRWLCQHFLILTGVPAFARLSESIEKKGERVIKYVQSLGNSTKNSNSHAVLKEMQEALDSGEAEETIRPQAVVLLLLAQFREAPNSLFLLHTDATATATDIERTTELPATPRLIVLGQSMWKLEKWMLSIEGKVVMNIPARYSSFSAALTALFTSYYVFNLEYQEGAGVTLEFIQRCFMCLNPDTGSKFPKNYTNKRGQVRRRKDLVNRHVTTLLNKLADFDSLWNCKH